MALPDQQDSTASPAPRMPPKPLKPPWIRHLWFLVAHVVFPALLSFGINFGISYPLYATRPDPVNVWWFPATLAGDLAVTIFVTVGLTYVLDSVAVHGDVANGLLRAQPVPDWLSATGADAAGRGRTSGLCGHAFARLVLFFISLPRPRSVPIVRLLFAIVVRAVALGAAFFPFFWALGIGVLYALPRIGNDNGSPVFENWPLPCIFKGFFGMVLAGGTTPCIAWFALVRCTLWSQMEACDANGLEVSSLDSGPAEAPKAESKPEAAVV